MSDVVFGVMTLVKILSYRVTIFQILDDIARKILDKCDLQVVYYKCQGSRKSNTESWKLNMNDARN